MNSFRYFCYSASDFVCNTRKIGVCSIILSFFCKVEVLIHTYFSMFSCKLMLYKLLQNAFTLLGKKKKSKSVNAIFIYINI